MISSTQKCNDVSLLKNFGNIFNFYGAYLDEVYVSYYQDQCTSKGDFFNQNIAEWFAFTNQLSKKPLVYINLVSAPVGSLKDFYQDSVGVKDIVRVLNFFMSIKNNPIMLQMIKIFV